MMFLVSHAALLAVMLYALQHQVRKQGQAAPPFVLGNERPEKGSEQGGVCQFRLEKPSVFLLTLLYFNARISSGLMVQSLYFIVERLVPYRLEPPEAVFLRAAFLVPAENT